MEILLVVIIGFLHAGGLYMLLRRSMFKMIIGLILLGNGANLLIFLLGRLVKGNPPVIEDGLKVFTDIYADPVPQALVLTAIVIGFGLQSFAIILIKRVYNVLNTDDLDELNSTDEEI
ncbi:Na+/H+ antiporter subunit C [Aquiflexum gelatinilyticum]|jgi:multicomponent Na+:H+ antiporter subunit C|uniref:Na+/H+ antiporter subunit C n=1 Tax=Aquiflexum gelatinilyticum TaxID=2961943 RepID=A0A9X2P6X9_9BACT|nr:Na+/H+ antiporter subunit C [Aquiflexum gelatinilyticum]MCR9017484.1 Na+/H+ antiporter subunit C [Aquiflexum gelatinilyticum]MCS4434652.1 Na+/H+ antiporter subunit C [Aquiflexum gelatinilyticum]